MEVVTKEFDFNDHKYCVHCGEKMGEEVETEITASAEGKFDAKTGQAYWYYTKSCPNNHEVIALRRFKRYTPSAKEIEYQRKLIQLDKEYYSSK